MKKLPQSKINSQTPAYNNINSRYLTNHQLKQKNATLEGVVVNNFIKDNSDYSTSLDDTFNTLVISDKETGMDAFAYGEHNDNKGFDVKKAMLPLFASTGSIFVISALLSLVFKNSAKKNLSEPFIKQLPAMGMNMNIVEETGFATYMALRDPNRQNILSAIAIFAFSALTLSAKKFVEGIKKIWLKKQEADIQRDLQEHLIDIETKSFSGKLALQRNMLSQKGEYFKTVLKNANSEADTAKSVYSEHFNFTSKEDIQDNKQKSKSILPYALISSAMLFGAAMLGIITFKNFKDGAKLQEGFIDNFKTQKQNILNDIIKNKTKDEGLLRDTLIKMGANKQMAKECAQKAGFDLDKAEEIASSVANSVENIWGNAPTGMSTESGKSFFYCYLNETRGHLYNWLIHNNNPFLRNLFFAMAGVSAASYIAQEGSDALKEVAVMKENANTELDLQKRLVEVEIKNFKAKKESAIAPLIEEFERKRKEGKAPEELKVMADNILLEIKNGPPFVYS